jgi:PAS domain S-box-containing protein
MTAPSVTWLGALLALLTLLLAAGAAVHERGQVIDTAQGRAELLARVLEEHATRSVETVGLALAALGETLAAEPRNATPQISQALTQTLANLPLLRAVAVVDVRGQVLASTAAADMGRTLDLARLGPLPAAGQDRLGPFVQGRSLAVLVARATPDAPAGVGFVPLVRALDGWNEGRLLVGLINADAIANHQQQTLESDHAAAMLATLQGRLLAATADVPQAPGAMLPPLPAFVQFLPSVEHASYVGTGAGGGAHVVAFRASRTRPLVVLVEMPLPAVLKRWTQDTWRLAAVAAVVATVLLLLTAVAARGQRGRRQAQAEVAAREREMSAIVGSVQELIFRTDAVGRLIFMNPHWQAVSPLPLDQALRRPLDELVHAESRDAVRALFALDGTTDGALKTRGAQVQIGPADAPRQFDVRVAPLHDGRFVTGFAGSAVDVTDRLADQARLRDQLAFNELMFEMLPLPVSMLDTKGRYLRVNRAWEDFTGRRRDDVLGLSARRLLPPEEAALHDAQDRSLLAQGGSLRYDATRRMLDGSRRDLSLTKAVVPGTGGQAAGVLVAFMDVSESARRGARGARGARRGRRGLARQKRVHRQHQPRAAHAAAIDHRLLGTGHGARARHAQAGRHVHRHPRRASACWRWSTTCWTCPRSRARSAPSTSNAPTCGRWCARCCASSTRCWPAAAPGDADLSDGRWWPRSTRLRFQQVVRNVLANAIKFSPPGAAIDLLGEATAEGDIHIAVRDQGPGIPPAELDKIFEAFVQSSKTKDGSGGTGLGLAICRKIVEAHGGRIRAENNADGGGSRFHIHGCRHAGSATRCRPTATAWNWKPCSTVWTTCFTWPTSWSTWPRCGTAPA